MMVIKHEINIKESSQPNCLIKLLGKVLKYDLYYSIIHSLDSHYLILSFY